MPLKRHPLGRHTSFNWKDSLKRRSQKRKPRLKHPVCKPCWELKYCPYGPLVEYFPLHPEDFTLPEVKKIHRRVRKAFEEGRVRGEASIWGAIEQFLWSFPPHWEALAPFDTQELGCNVFGHICPVFLMSEPFTETKEGRRTGRYIPRDIMLKVVRRDGQICQICNNPVRDNEVEFDHIIPFSKGGPVSADNLRLVCASCNREKRDSLDELLWKLDQN
jgi:hypothetical protein